jgi:hypothetical protein
MNGSISPSMQETFIIQNMDARDCNGLKYAQDSHVHHIITAKHTPVYSNVLMWYLILKIP